MPWSNHASYLLSPQARRVGSGAGFTLIELMVATAITVLVVAGTAITWVAATRNSREGGIDVQLDAIIEEDVVAIIDQSNRFTCCPGTCTSAASTITAAAATNPADCSTTTPVSENYYSPLQTDPAVDSAAMASFRRECRTPGALAETYIDEINAISVPTHSTPLSVVRDTPTVSDAASNRIRIQYTGSELPANNVLVRRVVEFIPPVARWCP